MVARLAWAWAARLADGRGGWEREGSVGSPWLSLSFSTPRCDCVGPTRPTRAPPVECPGLGASVWVRTWGGVVVPGGGGAAPARKKEMKDGRANARHSHTLFFSRRHPPSFPSTHLPPPTSTLERYIRGRFTALYSTRGLKARKRGRRRCRSGTMPPRGAPTLAASLAARARHRRASLRFHSQD